MTTALVSFPQLEIKWSRPDQPLVVGKDILELLSTSMYIDPMSMYREYIQNSADAIDVAQSAGLLHGPGRVEIRMDQSTRTVFIRDDGSGLGKEQFVQQLTALGGSKKRGTGARGFRGVGRLETPTSQWNPAVTRAAENSCTNVPTLDPSQTNSLFLFSLEHHS